MSEMGEAMKYLGPTSKALGVGLEESSAVLGILANSGIKGSLASRALGTAFTRLSKPTKIMQQSMKELGIDFFEEGKFIGVAGVVKKLEQSFIGLTQQQKAAHLSSIFGSESFQEMSILLDSGAEKIRSYTDELRNSRGVAKEIAETKLNNLAGDWTKLKSATSELAISLFNTLRPMLRGVVQAVTGFAQRLSVVGKWVKRNAVWLKPLVLGLISYVAVVKLSSRWTAIVSAAKKAWSRVTLLATKRQWAMNRAVLANPYVAVAAAVVALGVATVAYASSVNSVSAAQQAQLDVTRATKEAMVEEATEAQTLIDIFKDHTSTQQQKTAAYKQLKSLYPDILGKYNHEKEALENIDTVQKDIIDNIEKRAKAEAAADLLKDAQKELLELQEKGPGFWDKVKGLAVTAIDPIRGASAAQDSFLSKINEAKKRVTALAKTYREASRERLGEKKIETEFSGTLEKNRQQLEEKTETIVTGGKQQRIINVNIEKVLEMRDQVINEGGLQEANDLVDTVIEGLTRRLAGTFRV